MSFYMLRPGWQGTFRRSIRDQKSGEILRTVEFPPRLPVEIAPAEIGSFENDIGRAIVPVEVGKDGVIRVLFDEIEETGADEASGTETPQKSPPKGEVKKSPPKGGKPHSAPKAADGSD